jgi:UDP-glucose 4-epimerase
MKLNQNPEPEIKPLGSDDAASILLDPSRTFKDFGSVSFTALDEIVRRAVDHWTVYGVEGGYSHLKVS